jgi:glycerol uptake facilitator protein
MNAFFAEFFGTAVILVFGGGVVANVLLDKTKGNNSGWIVITFGWAAGVFTGVSIAAPYSGAHLNPAVTLALVLAHKFSPALMPLYFCAQLLGAMFGALLVWLAYKKHFDVTEDGDAKLAIFCTSPNIRSYWYNVMTEAIGTFVLSLAVLIWQHQKSDSARSMLCQLPLLYLALVFRWVVPPVMPLILPVILVHA